MKQILIVGVLVVAGLGYWFLAGGSEVVEAPNETAETASGEVVAVDLDGMAADGPALITMQTDGGQLRVIAVPSMGLPLCEAYQAIAVVNDISVGDRVSVRGEVDEQGRIVPCAAADHYLEVTAAE